MAGALDSGVMCVMGRRRAPSRSGILTMNEVSLVDIAFE